MYPEDSQCKLQHGFPLCEKCKEQMYGMVLTPFKCKRCGKEKTAPHSGDWHYCDSCANHLPTVPMCPLCGNSIATIEKAKWVPHHDDPPCFERLVDDECPVCHFRPPSQWVAIMAYCPSCDCRLKDKKCPQCGKTFAYE